DLQDVEDGGLVIYTTIDETLQREAEGMIEKHLQKVEQRKGFSHITRSAWQAKQKPGVEALTTYLQGGVVVLDNNTGGVVALVGGRDYQESKFNRAIQMQRQMGSTFKPFVYASAYEFGGLHPQVLI